MTAIRSPKVDERTDEQDEPPSDVRVAATRFLRAAAIQAPEAGKLADRLWSSVLSHATELPGAWVREALDLRDGAQPWTQRTVDLATAILMASAHLVEPAGGRR